MAIKKAYTIGLKFVGDGSSVTYAVNLSTDSFTIINDASLLGSGLNRQLQNSVNPLTPVPTACQAGVTASGIAFTGSITSNTLTITFATAPAANSGDSLIAILTA